MRIQNNQQQTPWINRKDQFRMLMMVAALGFVLFAIKIVAKPGFWDWVFVGQQQQSKSIEKKPLEKKRNLSVKLKEPAPLPPGVFRSPSPKEKNDVKKDSFYSKTRFSIPSKLLKDVKDDQLSIQGTEIHAYYTILAKVRDLPVDDVQKAAKKNIPFDSLIIDAAQHRGKLIHLKGKARRILPFDAGSNQEGIQQLYELWIFTKESSKDPLHIICTELPEGIPTGEKIKPVDVTVCGYFFKREGYKSKNGLRITPLILAKSPQWHQPVATAISEKNRTTYYLLGGVIAGILFVCLIVWRSRLGDKQFDKKFREQDAENGQAAVATLKENVEYTSLDEMFQKIKEEE